eukprot:362073-Chlamydomonas_euryale.AAC.2
MAAVATDRGAGTVRHCRMSAPPVCTHNSPGTPRGRPAEVHSAAVATNARPSRRHSTAAHTYRDMNTRRHYNSGDTNARSSRSDITAARKKTATRMLACTHTFALRESM